MCRLQEIKKAIEQSKSILIIAHIQPDGDTLGSCYALKRALEKIGKTAEIFCEDDIPPRYEQWVPKADVSKPDPEKHYDLAIAVDCADISRLGKAQKIFKRVPVTVNIDHHITNEKFAQLNYVVDASSTGEIIFELMGLFGIEQDEQTARYLYIAIATDTGNFTYSNTSRKCMCYAADLIELFDLRETADALFRRRSLVLTRLIARALSRLETYMDGKIAFVTLLISDMQEIGADGSDCENIVDFAREIEETKVAVFFRELPCGVKISLRSKGEVDVGAIAFEMGGGGHMNASGCCTNGKLDDAKKAVLTSLSKQV